MRLSKQRTILLAGVGVIAVVAGGWYLLFQKHPADVAGHAGRQTDTNSEVTNTSIAKSGRLRTVSSPHDPAYNSGAEEQKVARIVASRKNIAASYARLAELARSGNVDAAYQLFQDMLRCSSKDAAAAALEDLAAQSEGQQIIDQVARQIAETNHMCEGVTDEQIKSIGEWVTLAARGGNENAQLAFLGTRMSEYNDPKEVLAHLDEVKAIKAESRRHVLSAAMHGNNTALYRMAMGYYEGVLAEQDIVKAYGYMRALQVVGTAQSPSTYTQSWRQRMSAEQLAAAESLAAQIVYRIKHGG